MVKYIHNLGMHAGAKPESLPRRMRGLRFAEELRHRMTEPEKKLWEYFRTKPLGHKFRRQHPFSIYILDFYCHSARLAVEIDGKYHDIKGQIHLDKMRTADIKFLGLNELRFTNHEVMNDLEAVIQSIEFYIKQKVSGQATL